jgi:hypothetical protein
MKWPRLWIMLGILLFGGYFLWLLLYSNRFLAACNIHYWTSTSAQLEGCQDLQSQLNGK